MNKAELECILGENIEINDNFDGMNGPIDKYQDSFRPFLPDEEDPFLVKVDPTEDKLIKRLSERGKEFVVFPNKCGDIVIGNIVAIEDKRVNFYAGYSDYRASQFDGRKKSELYRQSTLFPISVLIIEGSDPRGEKGYRKSMINNMFMYDTHTLHMPDMDATIDFIYDDIIPALKEDRYSFLSIKKMKVSKTDLEQNRIRFLSGILDCGSKKVIELLEYFKTPNKVLDWIEECEILYTKTGNPKGISIPVPMKGYGWKFIKKNKELLG